MIRASPRHAAWFLFALLSSREFLVDWENGGAAVSRFAEALSSSSSSSFSAGTCASTPTPTPLLSQETVATIANGGVAVLRGFVPPDLVERLRADAKNLQKKGHFRPDGLTNNALARQGFSERADRQTFRNPETGEQSWFRDDLGDYSTRLEFDDFLGRLRTQLASDLDRPTLLDKDEENESGATGGSGSQRHEITYNWYEPGARLGRHLDEHHEETKGPRGWRYPSRRSVTWLVYLNDHWTPAEGGALLCHPRSEKSNSDSIGTTTTTNSNNNTNNSNHHQRLDKDDGPIGSHEGNLQVGWMDGYTPVYLDAFRESGQTAMYSTRAGPSQSKTTTTHLERHYWTQRDFDVPAQPIEFDAFLPEAIRPRFEQISTVRNDPRFARGTLAGNAIANGSEAQRSTTGSAYDRAIEVTPEGGTLVLFDSVTLPHSVLEVTGKRQRIAATGWFHEDSQFALEV